MIYNNLQKLSIFFLMMIMLSSCFSSKKMYYINDVNEQVQKIDSIRKLSIQKIQKGDRLSVIASCQDPAQTVFLNPFNNSSTGGSTPQSATGFLVDSSGSIDFPLIGATAVLNLSSQEAADKIKVELKKYYKDPYVFVSLNGKVSVINGRGGYSVSITNERLTILEVLAQPTAYEPDDRWDEVLIIREIDGKRTTAFIDLTSKEILNSPYYYLQNNDIVYVKPGKLNASLKSTTAVRSTIGMITGILALVVLLIKK